MKSYQKKVQDTGARGRGVLFRRKYGDLWGIENSSGYLFNCVSDAAMCFPADKDEENINPKFTDEDVFNIADEDEPELLDSSDDELEIDVGDMVYRSRYHEIILIDEIEFSNDQTVQNNRAIVVSGFEDSSVRPRMHSLLEEESEEIIDQHYGNESPADPSSPTTTVSVGRTQMSESSRSQPDEDPTSNSSGTQLLTSFYKEYEEALNHIEDEMLDQVRRFRCTLCGQSGLEKAKILTHIRMSHVGNDRKHPCPYCSYRFKLQLHLTRHVEIKHPGMVLSGSSHPSLNIEVPRDQQDHGTSALVTSGRSTSNSAIVPKRTAETAFSQNNDPEEQGTASRTPEDLEEEIQSIYDVFYDSDKGKRCMCISCGVVFDDEIKTREHILQTHKCPLCPELFMESESLQAHIQACQDSVKSTTPPTAPNNSEVVENKRTKLMDSKADNDLPGFPEEA